MKRNMIDTLVVASVLALFPSTGFTQGNHHVQQGNHPVRLHVNTKWKECSFQLDPALTQGAWRQFTREAGLVTYFRPLTDARPMGIGKIELSALRWDTAIDDSDDAWNDTFVHPDSTHWLLEGSGLTFPVSCSGQA